MIIAGIECLQVVMHANKLPILTLQIQLIQAELGLTHPQLVLTISCLNLKLLAL